MASYKKPIKKDDSIKIVCQNKNCKYMGKYQSINNFYKSRNESIQNHPFCKDCVNEMININNINTIYDILKALDTPFIMDIWNDICLEKEDNIFGSYLKVINFTQKKKYENLKWKDSIFELSDEKIKKSQEVQNELDNIPMWDNIWQGNYTKNELNYLNNYLKDLEKDFKIITRNHRDYAMKISQASLNVNKTFNAIMSQPNDKDVNNAYKIACANFDSLSKSAKFAESQRGANDVSLGCFGRVFDAVEKHNWVPEYIPDNKDIYDKLIEQFSNIEKSL